jgi:hypothetical protein
MSAKTPKRNPQIEAAVEAAIEADHQDSTAAPDPNRMDMHALSVVGLARSIGQLVKQVATDQRIPINAAHAIVKTALEYHLNSKALAQSEAQTIPFGARPVALADDSEQENN